MLFATLAVGLCDSGALASVAAVGQTCGGVLVGCRIIQFVTNTISARKNAHRFFAKFWLRNEIELEQLLLPNIIRKVGYVYMLYRMKGYNDPMHFYHGIVINSNGFNYNF